MKTIKRWTTGIIASFDTMISQIENHDALVETAIKDVHRAGAKARGQLQRVKRDGQRMRKMLQDLQEQEQRWKERAQRIAKDDKEKALECIRRLKRLEDQIAKLEVEEREHTKLEKQLGRDLEKIDDQLRKLREKRNLLRTRQHRAEALRAAQGEDTLLIEDIENIFERWESKVAEYEYEGGCFIDDGADCLEQGFKDEEEIEDLEAALDDLLASADQ